MYSLAQLHCSDSSSTARFCAFENVLFDFSKMSRVKRPGRSDSRKWDKGFLASHCSADKADINFYQVPILQETQCVDMLFFSLKGIICMFALPDLLTT